VDTTSRILSDSKLELKEYEDHESGGTADRPQFQAMMAAAAQRQFDLVLFWSLDRFTREGTLQNTPTFEQILLPTGSDFARLPSHTSIPCGIFKEAVIAILGTIAKQERVRISERVRAGLDRADCMEQGVAN
jgi:DNA invertase Pin-like site-specific DNA recombinase